MAHFARRPQAASRTSGSASLVQMNVALTSGAGFSPKISLEAKSRCWSSSCRMPHLIFGWAACSATSKAPGIDVYKQGECVRKSFQTWIERLRVLIT